MIERMKGFRTMPVWTWIAVGGLAIAIVLLFVKRLVG